MIQTQPSATASADERRLSVALERDPYDVVISAGGIDYLGNELRRLGIREHTKILVVSNVDVATPYGSRCLTSLEQAGFQATLLTIPAGEEQKTLTTFSTILDAAKDEGLERQSLMLALGGGIVGDMTGFAAACWLRGIGVIQVPTTLLAMVDAAIGGKTGVNHPGGKNLIGAFHQPRLVMIDPDTLQTLPTREFRAGLAEVIKYGVIGDSELFELLERSVSFDNPLSISTELLATMLERSAQAKALVVAADEKEGGQRAILNYGHTFGHVVETLTGYGTWLHGEAVAIGMVAVAALAVQRGVMAQTDAERQTRLIQSAGLPSQWPDLDPDCVLKTLQGDKKVRDGRLRFVLPSSIGVVSIVDDVSHEEIRACLAALR
ncbi:3-dehydroquinate synthase [Synechococcus sp. WH 8020]|uniref:3-dehydroquinate synthase n=1 Tax=Synechococcus sp. (strain WH8020) TaxID=32052 RepID=UPI0006526ADF|nr:3-dehydroquinate synthase [Synechococcus sp. WH 8020]AKN62150.1 3-dehydroquinate synthase [Synechococcus sp. WH 8020]